jgi:hypothetical protein
MPTRALELMIGRARVAVPVTSISRVVDVTYGALPLTHPLVLGLGFDEARPIVCIAIVRTDVVATNTKAVLFETESRLGYGLCIDEALDIGDVIQVERNTAQTHLPRWVRRARTIDGRLLGWIDADVLIDELTELAVRS